MNNEKNAAYGIRNGTVSGILHPSLGEGLVGSYLISITGMLSLSL